MLQKKLRTEIGLVQENDNEKTLDRHGPNIQTIAIFLSHLISRYCYIYSAKCSLLVAPWFPEFSDLGPVIHMYYCMYSMYAGAAFKFLQKTAEVEFLEEIQTEVLRVFLLAIHRHLY